ncbi:MAG: nuclear transport factor 2 family protein [Bryobacteraceae bacterium]
MSNHLQTVNEMCATFGRGDVDAILSHLAENVSWEFEAPKAIGFGGIRRGRQEAVGFFTGIAEEHAEPVLKMSEFVASGDVVAAFGRYEATVKKTGIRVNTPVVHYFKFDQNGKVLRYQNLINTGAFLEAAQGKVATTV